MRLPYFLYLCFRIFLRRFLTKLDIDTSNHCSIDYFGLAFSLYPLRPVFATPSVRSLVAIGEGRGSRGDRSLPRDRLWSAATRRHFVFRGMPVTKRSVSLRSVLIACGPLGHAGLTPATLPPVYTGAGAIFVATPRAHANTRTSGAHETLYGRAPA